LLAAGQGVVGNRRPEVGVRRGAGAVLHSAVTIHSNVRLFTRGAVR